MLYLLIAIVSGSCPRYSCAPDSSSFPSDTCSRYSDSVYHLYPCRDPIKSSCSFVGQQTGTCNLPKKTYSYPGEKCSTSSDCIFSEFGCQENICQGLQSGDSCADSKLCAPGLYCNSLQKCIAQIALGDSGCTTDFDCVNNGVCDGGVCTEFSSIVPKGRVRSCSNGMNYACQFHTCTSFNSSYFCMNSLRKLNSNPVKCEKSSDCNSLKDPYYGDFLPGKCSCGHNEDGNSYCKVMPGDEEYLEWLKISKKWHNTRGIHRCNTMRRRADKCITDWLGYSARIKLLYWTKLVWEYEVLQNNDYCVENTLHYDFKVLEKQFLSL